MKKNLSILMILVAGAGLLWSCEKDLVHVNTFTTTDGLAFVKVVHAAPNFRAVLKGADSVNIYVNGNKINGAFLTYNSMFPVLANLYAAVPAGAQSIRVTVNGKLTPDSITLFSLNKTLDAGGFYSLIITDSILNANNNKQMWIRDQFTLTDTTHYTLRFVDAVMNDNVNVDVYSFRAGANVFTNIAPGTATPFVTMPYTLLSDTFYVRATGTMNEITRMAIVNGSTTAFNRNRAYTLLYKGALGLTGTKARALTVYVND